MSGVLAALVLAQYACPPYSWEIHRAGRVFVATRRTGSAVRVIAGPPRALLPKLAAAGPLPVRPA